MDVGAAEGLGVDHFAGRGLHQRRAAEKDGALIADDDRLVRHRRNIGAAGRAGAHHDGDLGNALRGHARLVVEDAAEMLPVGEDLVLIGKVRTAGIHEIDAGEGVLLGDLLGPQMLLHGHGVVGAALDRRVVDDDDAITPLDTGDAGDEPGAGDLLAIEPVGGERR